MRPALLLDVDGPLNPRAAKPERRPEGYRTHRLLTPRWVAAQHDGPALLLRIDPRRGLAAADFAALTDWAAGLD